MENKITKKLVVVNQLGIHARPAAYIVKEMQKFESNVFLIYNGSKRNAKSVLQVLSLGAPKDAEIVAEAEGADAESAIEKLTEIFESGFGEE